MMQLGSQRTSIVSLSQLLESTPLGDGELEQLLLQCKILPDDLENPATALSLEQEFTMIRALIRYSNNHYLGLRAGECYRLNTFGALGLAAISAASFRDAIELFIHYLDLTYTLFSVQFSVTEQGGYIEFNETDLLGDLYSYYRDRDLSFAVTAIKDIYPEGYAATIKRLELKGPVPEKPEVYEDFFECAVLFNKKQNRFIFDKKALEIPLPQANKLNLKIYATQCDQQLEVIRKKTSFSEEVSDKIRFFSKEHIPSQDEVANKLSVTARTIRRKLKAEGTSYQQLLGEMLRQKANNLLENSKLSIEEIGNQLGYSEPAAFIRAYKQWTGKTPLQVRHVGVETAGEGVEAAAKLHPLGF